MFGPTPFRDISLIAGFELREMLRSRRAIAVISLYLLVATLTTLLFVAFLTRANDIAANPAQYMNQNQGGPGNRGDRGFAGPIIAPPGVTATGPSQAALFSRRSPFRGLLAREMSDPATLDYLVEKPPIVLWYTLSSFWIVPFLIMITVSESIAQEHQSRGVRFVALRTGKAEFALGKIFGQGLFLALSTLLAGGLVLAIAAWRLQDFALGPAVAALLVFWPRIVIYSLPFVAVAGFFSMNTRSTMLARAGALVGLCGLWLVHQLSATFVGTWFDRPENVLDFLVPNSHQDDLWAPFSIQVAGSMGVLAALTVLYLAVGLCLYRKVEL